MAEQESAGADVVQLFQERGDRGAPVTAKPRDPSKPQPRECKHRHTEVDADEQRVICRDCGELVDPFKVLLELAREDGRWREARDEAMRAARLAAKRLEDLRLEERRATNRLRSMRSQERDLKNRLDRLDAELRAFTPDP